MSNKVKSIIVSMCMLGLIVFFGCASIQDVITPCYVEPGAIVYANEESTSFLPYTSLWDAERISRSVDYIHRNKQVDFARKIEDDTYEYTFLNGLNTVHIQRAEELKQTLFSPSGPVGLAIPTLFGGVLGGLLIKRPGDKSKKEIDLENGTKV